MDEISAMLILGGFVAEGMGIKWLARTLIVRGILALGTGVLAHYSMLDEIVNTLYGFSGT